MRILNRWHLEEPGRAKLKIRQTGRFWKAKQSTAKQAVRLDWTHGDGPSIRLGAEPAATRPDWGQGHEPKADGAKAINKTGSLAHVGQVLCWVVLCDGCVVKRS